MFKSKKHAAANSLLAPITLLVVCSILLSVIIVAALMMRPVADDFAYFSDPSIHNPLSFAIHYYFGWTGRFMQALWMSSLHKAFDEHTVVYGTILQLAILAASGIFCVFALLRKTAIHNVWVVALGLAACVLFAYMSPSFFDTNLWITSSSVYIGSAIALLTSLGLSALVSTTKHAQWWHYAGFAIVVFLSQLFSEPTSIIMIYMGLVALAGSYLFKRRRERIVSWLWTGASIAGFLFMYLSPGTRTRQGELQTHPALYDILFGSIHSLDKLSYIFTSYRIWLIVALALAITPLLMNLRVRQRLYILVVSIVSAVAIPLSLFVATQYTMDGYTPLRALTVPIALLAFALITIIATTLSWLMTYAKRFPRIVLSITTTLLLLAVGFAAVSASIPTLQAVAMRMNLYDARTTSIQHQVDTNQQTIQIDPLPLLLDNTEALDMNYDGAATPAWLTDAFRNYYAIPSKDAVTRDTQPPGYCVPHNNPVWFGTKTCAELEKDQ